ncbi:MAG TPA: hypothetical protein VHW06_13515 [Streptosporangiaceae bacterium]|nr:hypothetical protein [Streptosporangiaceae bacterium]
MSETVVVGVDQAARNLPHDLEFPVGEGAQSGRLRGVRGRPGQEAFDEAARGVRSEQCLTGVDDAYGVDDAVGPVGFEEEAGGAGAQGIVDILIQAWA